MIGDWVSRLVGAALVLSVLQDVFFTVLFPASGHGVLRRPLARAVWSGFRGVARGLEEGRRRRFLAYSGPVQISLNLGAWILLLTIGFALVYLPALGSRITASSGPTAATFASAVYYSGYSVTTLGVGDLVARNALYRLLTVIEAGIGFATVSMAVTYFLSVYSALTQRKVTAAQLHHHTYDTGQAVELLAGLAQEDGHLPGAADELGRISAAIQHSLETHAAYPVLRYFHQRHVYYSLPRIVLLGLETVTIVRSVLDPDRYRQLIGSPAVAGLSASADQLLTELVPDLTGVPDHATEQDWRRRGERAADRLAEAGLGVRADRGAVADDYVALRAGWDPRLRALAQAMVYDWSTIEPSGDPPGDKPGQNVPR